MASEPMGVAFILIAGLLLILPQLVMPVFAQIYLDEVIGNAMEQLAETNALGHGSHHWPSGHAATPAAGGDTQLEKRLTRASPLALNITFSAFQKSSTASAMRRISPGAWASISASPSSSADV